MTQKNGPAEHSRQASEREARARVDNCPRGRDWAELSIQHVSVLKCSVCAKGRAWNSVESVAPLHYVGFPTWKGPLLNTL